MKILGYKTHQKIESYQKDVMNLRTIGMQTLFVNINKSEKVTHLMIYVKTKARSSDL